MASDEVKAAMVALQKALASQAAAEKKRLEEETARKKQDAEQEALLNAFCAAVGVGVEVTEKTEKKVEESSGGERPAGIVRFAHWILGN